MRTLRWVAVGSLLVVSLGWQGGSVASARSTCDDAWHVDDPALPHTSVSSIDPQAPDDVWAVGGAFDARLRYRPMIRHRDAAGWSTVPVPSPAGAKNAVLVGIDAAAIDDAWAIGFGLTGPPRHQGLVSFTERWDGSTWSQVPVPRSASTDIFTDVAVDAPDDAWVVGLGIGSLSSTRTNAILLRWQGTSWSRVDLPFTRGWAATLLSAIQIVSADDIWIAGSYLAERRGPQLPLVAHFDGTTWSQASTPQPKPGKSWTLNDLAAIGGEIWAVGGTGRSLLTKGPLVLRWDGSTWTSVPLTGVIRSGLSAVAGASPSDVWLMPSPSLAKSGPEAVHWDGASWTVSDPPVEAGLPIGSTYPTQIATDGSGGVWFTGGTRSLSSFTLHRCSAT